METTNLNELTKNQEVTQETVDKLQQIVNANKEAAQQVVQQEQIKEETAVQQAVQQEQIQEVQPQEEVVEDKQIQEVQPTTSIEEKEYDEIVTVISDDKDEEEIEDDDDEFDDIDNMLNKDEIINVIKSKVVEKLRPHKLDLHSFTVASPVKVANLVSNNKPLHPIDTIDWYLPVTDVNITMRRFEGSEIIALGGIGNSNQGKSVRNANLDILRLIYDHVTNENKPEFEVWIKSVANQDLEQLYFAILVATFKDSNYLVYACENKRCKDIDLVHKDYRDMIHFYDEKEEEKFYKHIEEGSYTYTMDAIEMEFVPITDKYCVTIKNPSLYDQLIEPTFLREKYRKENEEKIAIISYIDTIYRIDAANQTLIPVDYSLKTEDSTKIIRNKYRLYMQFLNSLNSDQFTYLTSIINKVVNDQTICEFIIPEHTCEKCKTKIEPKESSALKLLFTRHQLAALATI
jgi:hypothetical protein